MMSNKPARPVFTAEVTPEFCAALGVTSLQCCIDGVWYYAYRLPNAVLVPFGTFVEVWSHSDITEWRGLGA